MTELEYRSSVETEGAALVFTIDIPDEYVSDNEVGTLYKEALDILVPVFISKYEKLLAAMIFIALEDADSSELISNLLDKNLEEVYRLVRKILDEPQKGKPLLH